MTYNNKNTVRKCLPSRMPGDPKDSEMIASVIRVDHAGEYGAKRIYQGQIAAMQGHNKLKVVEHMLEQELKHLDYFEQQIAKHHVRPTLFLPIWHVCGYMMGYVTAKMGYKAAMACTVAVEEKIEQHYGKQLQLLKNKPKHYELREKIALFRQEEIDHHDTGLAHGARRSFGYQPLRKCIGFITRMAIRISTKW